MSGTLAPCGPIQYFDDDGRPVAGGFLETYLADTSDPEPTFQDSALLVPNDNPITLDGAGRAVIFLAAKAYKFILKDINGAVIWSIPRVPSTALGQAQLGVVIFNFLGAADSPISDTTYPSGSGYSTLHAGSSIYEIDSSDLAGDYVLVGMLRASAGESTSAALVNLSDGSHDVPIATITTTDTDGEPLESGLITLPAPGSVKRLGIKVKVSGGAGAAWGLGMKRL
jgi:hypothetical protein